MENFIVSARKYRPATFDSVVGQKALITTLKNAILTHKLAHAYLFCGPRGVGKTTCARIFAKSINCEHLSAEGEACNECESCRAFNEQRSYNIHELDAASNNSVDDIRELIDQVRIPPQVGKYKVFIIDEVHMLSTAAFNAFLKTLEEPPQHAIFILATTERHKVLPTILSRCQIYDFTRIELNDIVNHLKHVAEKEGIKAEKSALHIIAQKADGGMRDALSLFDQLVSYTQGNVTYQGVIDSLNILDYEYYFRFTDYFLENKVSECMLLFNDVLNRGFDGGNFITNLTVHLRDLLVSSDEATLPLLEVSENVRDRYREQAKKCTPKFLIRAIKICNNCDMNYRTSKNKRLLVELTLIQLSQLTSEDDDVSSGLSPKRLKPLFNKTTNVVSNSTNNSNAARATANNNVAHTNGNGNQAAPTNNTTAHTGYTTTNGAMPNTGSASSAAPQPQGGYVNKTNASASSVMQDMARLEEQSRHIPIAKGHPGFSLLHNGERKPMVEKKQPQVAATPEVPLEDLPVSEDGLRICWKKLAGELPKEESATAGRMLNIRPILNADNSFTITIDNTMVAEDFHNLKNKIEAYLRKNLQNRQLRMNIVVQENVMATRIYSPQEKYQEMVKHNPALGALKEAFDLDLT